MWKLGQSIERFKQRMQFEISYWGKVWHRIINVTLYLAQNNLTVTGHKESLGKF